MTARRAQPELIAVAAFALATVVSLASAPLAAEPVQAMAGDEGLVAVNGYDPLGYFLMRKPHKGSPFFTVRHDGRIWRFASVLNRATFMTDPDKFAPQFGGGCAYAASQNTTNSADPTVWRVQGGKLYLFHDGAALAAWLKEPLDLAAKADGNWPALRPGTRNVRR